MTTPRVVITDVVLRDGLQDEDVIVATNDKLAIANALIAAGITNIEAASFVSPIRVPQMADADALIARLPTPGHGVRFSALALNTRGVERAVLSGIELIEIAASASPSHSQANAGKSSDSALTDLASAVAAYPATKFIGAVSTAFVCPFDGVISADRLVEVVKSLAALGVERIGLADTLGIAATDHVLRSVEAVRAALPEVELGLHLHNADGQALQTALAAVQQLGIVHFDSAIGGYGGCPFAPGAHGNVATEELVAHFHANGIRTNVDERALRIAVDTVRDAISRSPAVDSAAHTR